MTVTEHSTEPNLAQPWAPHRVKVYLSGDLALPDYASHTMPSNL